MPHTIGEKMMDAKQKRKHLDDHSRAARELELAGLGVTGVGKWCAPGPANEQCKKWLVLFEDTDRGQHTFDDETEAYLFFGKAEAMGWSCHLFEHAPRVTPNEQGQQTPACGRSAAP